MKNLLALIVVYLTLSTDSIGQNARFKAAKGDTVWVIINHIKPGKKQQFEKFITETFWGASKNLKPEDQRVFKQTRVLYPAKPEADGTLSYIFLMDPLIPGGDYEIESLLRKMYGIQKAEEYNKVYNETSAAEQTMYIEVQSDN